MWVDIVFWVLIALFAIIGLWKGFFDSLLSLLGSAVSVGVSIWLAKPAAAFINKIVNIPNLFLKLLDKVFQNDQIISVWGNSFTKQDLSAFLSLVFAGLVVFILIKLSIWLIAKLFDNVTKKSTIASGLNKLFGLLFGLVKGGFIVCVALALCSILANTQVFGNAIDNAINKSTTTKWAYKYVDEFTEKQLSKIDMQEFLKDLISKNSESSSESENVSADKQVTITITDINNSHIFETN